ncbi:MAG: rhamnogalacturonan acetylesterase [Chthoniobacteraceae bacterium]
MTRRLFLLSLLLALTAIASEPRKPTLFLIGDSTVKNSTRGFEGWGSQLSPWFDASKIHVENRALGGRSSRSYLREGLWEKVRAELQPGDFVLVQFGHNDNGPMDTGKARASIKGSGDETREVTIQETGTRETVRTYGGYIRQYVQDTKAKGATPIVCSLVPRNIWKDGRVTRATNDFAKWTKEIADSEGVAFLDLNELIASEYEQAGEAKVRAEFFTTIDHTHTTPAGAKFSAAIVAKGLRTFPHPLASFLANPQP